jgi:hypothetical protein
MALVRTDVMEEHIASTIMVKKISEMENILAVTTT